MDMVVNGSEISVNADRKRLLLFVLRNELDLTGTKYGCGEGQCGACTVLVDGRPMRSCQLQLGQVEGKKITTIEGVARGTQLHPVQQSFIDCDAMQCGYCTSGMIVSSVALLQKTSKTQHCRDQGRFAGECMPLRNVQPDCGRCPASRQTELRRTGQHVHH